MAHIPLDANPVFNKNMEAMTTSTPANGETEFNPRYKQLLENDEYLRKKYGRVLIGTESTELEPNDTLFVIEQQEIQEAEITNIAFGDKNTVTNEPNLAITDIGVMSTGTRTSTDSITKKATFINGKLTVSEAPEPDTVFFAKT